MAAARQGLSESALLKRLIEQMLASAEIHIVTESVAAPASRDARLTVRLVPEDQALLRERAAARSMPAATYVSVLVRSHLRRLAPLPDRELSSLQAAVRELTVGQTRVAEDPGTHAEYDRIDVKTVAYERPKADSN